MATKQAGGYSGSDHHGYTSIDGAIVAAGIYKDCGNANHGTGRIRGKEEFSSTSVEQCVTPEELVVIRYQGGWSVIPSTKIWHKRSEHDKKK